MISLLLDLLGGAFLLLGLVLITIGLYGVLRLPDTYAQLHAQGLATGPGAIAVLASSIATENAAIITFAALGIAFVVLTSPMSSHAIARVAHSDQRQSDAGREGAGRQER